MTGRPGAGGRRSLHPAAWWLWAACMAVAALRTTNPILLGLLAAVAGLVVSARRTSAPWARSLVVFVRLGLVVIVLRVVLEIVFGDRLPGHVLFTLPQVPLPSWAAGVSVGGPVTAEGIVQAAVGGLQLAVVLVCFGAANSLASPYRLLRCLPAVLYEAGVAVTVTLTFVPEVVAAIAAVRGARRLRGRPVRGLAGIRGMAIPVLESALDRSLELAASMDSRGYGRRVAPSTGWRRAATVSTAAGFLLVFAGVYGVLASSSMPGGGVPFLAVGALLIAAGMAARGRRTTRTRYRPDRWLGPEWTVAASGGAVVAGFLVASALGTTGLDLSVYPLAAPTLPLLLVAAALVGLVPAVAAPAPSRPRPATGAERVTAPGRPERGPGGMIRFADVSFTYDGADAPTLAHVDLAVDEGELCLVVGQTGSGKTTLLRAVNGLVPHFTGGTLSGDVAVDGRSTRDHPPRELADVVGMVGQNPAASFVTDVVEDELAYTMENLGVPAAAMRRRVEDALDLLGLHDLRDRPLTTLSGGQQQRVAIAAVLGASPRVLVLDEPTSALDPAAAEEVLASLTRLVHDLGLTVLLAEHRLERVLPFADRVVLVPGRGRPVVSGPPAEVIATSPVAPPLVELARVAGWDPVPLSVRDARRQAGPLRARLEAARPSAAPAVGPATGVAPGSPVPPGAAPAAEAHRVVVAYGDVLALDGISLTAVAGEVVAVMGRNGSGKSTLLAQLAGVRGPDRGRVRVGGEDPAALTPRRRIGRVGLVPQDAGVLLYGASVAEECASADRDTGLEDGTTAAVLDTVLPGLPRHRHPRDLSEGQRLALALALVLAPAPPLLLLDEPTRGLDYPGKERLVRLLAELAAAGACVVVASHDVELVARVATRVVVLAEGEVVADGPAREVVCHSPVFAPQVAKVLAPEPWLTVHEVRARLEEPTGAR